MHHPGFGHDAVTPRCDAPGSRLRALAGSMAAGVTVVLTALPAAAQPQAAQRVIVVSSSALAMYEDAVDGMRALPGVAVEAATLGADNSALNASLSRVDHATAVVTLGNRASEFVAKLQVALPVVHCMVSGDVADNPSGLDVPLAIPVSVEALWLHRLLPQAHVIAILYTPSLNERAAQATAAELTALGFTAMTQAVAAPDALPQALRNIAKADALLAIPGGDVYAPELSRGLLLFTYRTHTPLVAYSQAWVRDGALYGVEWKYKELGSYCGALAVAAVAPGSPAAPPPMPQPRVSVNLRIAAQLNLDWKGTDLSGVEKINE